MPEDNNQFVFWKTPEYQQYQKDVSWYWIVAITGIALTAAALWQKNLLFAIFVVIAALMLIVWGQKKPRIIKVKLDETILRLDDQEFLIKDFLGYYIDDEVLVFKRGGRFSQPLKIDIDTADKDKIAAILKDKLVKFEYQESLGEIIGRKIGF